MIDELCDLAEKHSIHSTVQKYTSKVRDFIQLLILSEETLELDFPCLVEKCFQFSMQVTHMF
jgi:hypothetical protein